MLNSDPPPRGGRRIRGFTRSARAAAGLPPAGRRGGSPARSRRNLRRYRRRNLIHRVRAPGIALIGRVVRPPVPGAGFSPWPARRWHRATRWSPRIGFAFDTPGRDSDRPDRARRGPRMVGPSGVVRVSAPIAPTAWGVAP